MSLPRQTRAKALLAAASFIAATLIALAWQPGLAAPYQYDDYVTPLKDPASQSLTSWFQSVPRTLRPLTKLTYAAESSLGVESAPARRVLHAALFLSCAALMAVLSWQVGLPLPMAGALAVLWAVHPMHAETVIALAGRSVLLSLFLTLVSACFVLRGRRSYAVAFAVAAVLARETALPWLVACVGLTTWKRTANKTAWLLAIFFSACAGAALVLSSSRLRALLAFSFSDPGALNRLGLQWAALPRGVLMMFMEPAGFTVDMEFLPHGGTRALYLLAAIAMYAVAGWLVISRSSLNTTRILTVFWLCWVLPLHSIVPKLDPFTARSTSASSAALVCLLALVLGPLVTKWRAARWLFWPLIFGLLAALVNITRGRAELYADPIALWRDAAQRTHHNTRPLINLGTLLAQDGQLAQARAAFVEALRRNPNGSDARERLSAVDVLIGTRRLLTEPKLDDPPHEDRTR